MGTLEDALEESGFVKQGERWMHHQNNLCIAGMNRERYFELLEQS